MSSKDENDFECECESPKVMRCSCLDKAESEQDKEHIWECVEAMRKKADFMEDKLSE